LINVCRFGLVIFLYRFEEYFCQSTNPALPCRRRCSDKLVSYSFTIPTTSFIWWGILCANVLLLHFCYICWSQWV